jgi:hypothetical protein
MKRALALAALLLFLYTGPTFAETAPSYVELADAPTITVDWSKGDTQAVTLHGNRTLLFANGRKGAKYTLVIKQDATGSRLVAWPPSVHWPGEIGHPSLTTIANRKDYLTFICDGPSYDAVGFAQNL